MAAAPRNKHSKLDAVQINQGLTVIHPDPDQPRKLNEEISVDIIAVPGLGANPEWTWKGRNKVDWLRDMNMLTRTIPNAKIMVFEYESQWFGKGSIDQRLSNVADQLVLALVHSRSRGSTRPIVFVCHCLGGIVVEKALLTAKLHQSDYPNIFMSVVGCVFLGTPFRGTRSQTKASLLAGMASTVGLGTNSGLVKLLEEDSEILKDLLDDFVSLAKEANMRLFCFFEQHETDMMRLLYKNSMLHKKEIVVDEDSAKILGFGKAPLASDHFELNKFTGPKDGRYILVSGEINATVQKARSILKSRQNAIRQTLIDDGTYQKVLDDLKVTDPFKDMEASVRGRPASQASWVLSNDSYMKWMGSNTSKVLWAHGNAGKGQAVIACSLVGELSKQLKDESASVAYFFCDEKDSHRRTALDVLRLLVRQMILRKRDLTEYLLADQRKAKQGDQNTQKFSDIPTLWNNLQSMFKDHSVGTAYFIVNGLDEIDGESRKEFLNLLSPYLETQPDEEGNDDESIVKWIFLSRSGRPDIEKTFQKALVIDMEDKENVSHVNDAVKAEISSQVDMLAKKKNYNAALAYFIKRHIYSRAEGNYIYVNLVIQELKNCGDMQNNNSSLRRFLEAFPFGLTEMFEHIRRRVLNPQSDGIEYTKEIFRTLILARRSPTIFELALLADLPLKDRDDEAALKRYIAGCGAFLTITEDDVQTVEWIDIAAKEHLETYASEQLSLSLSDVQHGIIALRCMDYVRSISQEQQHENEYAQNEEESLPQEGITSEDVPTKDQDMPGHEPLQSPVEDKTDVDAGEFQHQGDQGQGFQTANYQNEQHRQNYHSSSYEGNGYGSDSPNQEYPPREYIGQGHNSQVGAAHDYLGHGSRPYGYTSPPHTYSQKDSTQSYEAQNNAAEKYQAYRPGNSQLQELQDDTVQTPLDEIHPQQDQESEGHDLENHELEDPDPQEQSHSNQDVELLPDLDDNSLPEPIEETRHFISYPGQYWLEHAKLAPVDIVEEFDLTDEFWRENSSSRAAWWNAWTDFNGYEALTDSTPLHVAAMSGYSALLDYLLEKGREEEIQKFDSWGFRPLYWACQKGDIYVVQRLLKAGADVNAHRKDWNLTAIWIAASEDHDEIVQYLLDNGAEVDVQDDDYGTPLYVAAENGCVDVVKQLLEHGANVNLAGGLHLRPLNAAAFHGHLEVAQLLVQTNVEIDPEEDYRYGSALGAAARKGHDGIARLLLAKGWNANRKVKIYGSLLVAAATYGHVEVVQVLLEKTPDATSREHALEIATKNGKTEVTKKLIEQSLHLRHQKAYILAASYGRDDILELLQKLGTNPEMLNTALYEASDHEHESTVGLLIKFGADPDSEGKEYGTALTAAAYDGSEGIVQLLIEHNADVNKQGGDYGNALQAAAVCGAVNIVQILLDHGANVNTEPIGIYGNALQAACFTGNEDVVNLLLNRGANINAQGGLYGYPIIAAADEGDVGVLEILVKHGAEVNVKGYKGNSPAIVLAGYSLPKESMGLLLDHGADIEAADDHGNTVLITTANSGDAEGLEFLLMRGANIHACGEDWGTALHAAASEGDEECCELLIKSNADIDQQGGPWGSALQAAAFAADLDCVKLLLNAGADVHFSGGEYGSALQAAAFSGDLECLQALLDAGANVDQEDGKFGCALQAAASAGNLEGLRALLQAGAEVNLEGGMYNSALQAAAARNGTYDCVELLFEHGSSALLNGGLYGSVMQAAAVGNNLNIWEMLVEHGANLHAAGGKYGNALQAAVLNAEDDFVRRLLEHSVEVNQFGGKYGSALQAAAYANRPETVTLLLEHHADVHITGGLYGNALNAAVCKGNTRVLSLLLDKSLPDVMLDEGLLQAAYHRQAEVVGILLKNGANIEARNQELGSALDALQKELQMDPNSDDEGDQYSDADNDTDADDDVEDEDNEADNVPDDEDKDTSVFSLQFGEQGTEESKVLKILEDAMSKVKRNPTVKRFRSVRRKAAPQYQYGGDSLEVLGSSHTPYLHVAQALRPAEPGHPPHENNSWQASRPKNFNPYESQQHRPQNQTAAPVANSRYQVYGNAQNAHPYQLSDARRPTTAGSTANTANYQAYSISSAQDSHHPYQYGSTGISQSAATAPAGNHQVYGVSSAPIPVQPQHNNQYQQYPPYDPPAPPAVAPSPYHTPPPLAPSPYHSPTPPAVTSAYHAPTAAYHTPHTSYNASSPVPSVPAVTAYRPASPAMTSSQYNPPSAAPAYQAPLPPASPYPPRPPVAGGPSGHNSSQNDDLARLQAKVSKFSSSVSNFWK